MKCPHFQLVLAVCALCSTSACVAISVPPESGESTDGGNPADGSILPEGDGSVLPEGDGSVLPEGDGSILPEGDGSVLPEGDGSILPGSDAGAPGDPLLIETAFGRVEGDFVGATREFLGIPYAEPPVGTRRFAPPVAKAAWPGILEAHSPGPLCPQNASDPVTNALRPNLPQSEDCLTLNVYAPQHVPAKGAPVMVFIHGGNLVTGGGALYDSEFLSQAGDAVVVTINYRLGVLGFFAHPALDNALGTTSGNMGLRDQQLALRWVQQNIAAFGGDPTRVTLFGESAGSVSVCFHMFTPESQGLAQGFIMESGSCLSGEGAPWTPEYMKGVAQGLVDDLCKGQSDVVSCLQALPTETLRTWLSPQYQAAKLFTGVANDQPWWPLLDGKLIVDQPQRLLRAGKFAHQPFIVGSNAREFALLLKYYGFPNTPNKLSFAFYANLMLPQVISQAGIQQVLDRYTPATDADANEAWIRLWSDMAFRCPARQLARGAQQYGVDAYLYNFDIAPQAHTQELDYVFGWPGGKLSKLLSIAPPNPQTIAAIQGYWTEFAHTGVPSAAGQPEWAPYDLTKDENLRLAEPISYQSGLSAADCDMWDQLLAVQ